MCHCHVLGKKAKDTKKREERKSKRDSMVEFHALYSSCVSVGRVQRNTATDFEIGIRLLLQKLNQPLNPLE